MILDIYQSGCTIWIGENVTSIKGRPEEICEQIYMRSVVPRETNSGVVMDQIYDINIDIAAPGGPIYKDILTSMGLTVGMIRSKHIDAVLPKRVHYVGKQPEMKIDFIDRFRF